MMISTNLFLAMFFVICAILLGLKSTQQLTVKRRERFQKRDVLSLDEIYNKFYLKFGLDKAEVLKYWVLVVESEDLKESKLNPGVLRPEDRFDRELGSVTGYPIPCEFADLEELIEKKAKELSINKRKIKIDTLDDFIKFMLQK